MKRTATSTATTITAVCIDDIPENTKNRYSELVLNWNKTK